MSRNAARCWDRIACKYAADPIADLEGYERTLAAVRPHLQGRVAFEFGCGTGTTALKLAPHSARYIATDISDAMSARGPLPKADRKLNSQWALPTPRRCRRKAWTWRWPLMSCT